MLALWAFRKRCSWSAMWCFLTSKMDQAESDWATIRSLVDWKRLHKFNCDECVPWWHRRTCITLWWCHTFQATYLYIASFFWFKVIVWKSVLRVLQFGVFHSVASWSNLCNGRRYVCSQWNKALYKAMWYDGQVNSHHTETNPPMCSIWGHEIW